VSYALGIDFGTTFSAAVVQRVGNTHVVTLGNRSGSEPSVLLVRPDATLLFGEQAALRGVGEPTRLLANLKRRLGDPGPVVVEHHAFRAHELVGEYLRWIVDRVREREGGPAEVIAVGYPANWGAHRAESFAAALDHAGLAGSPVVTEPYAAALFHAGAHEVAPGERLAVYDLGGGTFDAAVLRRTGQGFEIVGNPEGVEHLGGLDFDEALLHLVRARSAEAWVTAQRQGGSGSVAAAAALRRECVAAKEILSTEERVSVPVLLPGVDPVDIERRAFEVMIRPAIEESLGAFRRALRSARVTPTDLAAVLLVGGSSRIPLVRNLVAAEVAGTTLLDSDPRYAVARGAAAFAALASAGETAAAPQPVGAGARTVNGSVISVADAPPPPPTPPPSGPPSRPAADAELRPAPSGPPDYPVAQADLSPSRPPSHPVAEADSFTAPMEQAARPAPSATEESADAFNDPWGAVATPEPFVMLSRRQRKRLARADRRRSRARALIILLVLVALAAATLILARSAGGTTLTDWRDPREGQPREGQPLAADPPGRGTYAGQGG
jgi:actin-like ATPase involved in cell morphogenesis